MINGIINVYKEKDYTSHDVVAKLRGIFRQKKIGHTGTLDPQAEGVLPVCLGKATKVCDLLTEKDKVYQAVLLLGQTTDTQDTSGTLLAEQPVTCSEEEVIYAVKSFVGTYGQIPPMYSALKVNGKKLCDLARAGIEVERKARPVTIFSIEIKEINLPRVTLQVHCSKGTYIRTLCQDIGEKLGCGGCMESLLRVQVAQFLLKDAWKLSEIEALVKQTNSKKQEALTAEKLGKLVLPTDTVFASYPKVHAAKEFEKVLYNGNPLQEAWLEDWKEEYVREKIRVYDTKEHFIGIYQYEEKRKDIRPVKIFME